MNWKLAVICCVLLHAPAVMAADDVYKWKDAEGRVRYTDAPPPGKIPYQNMSRKKQPASNADAASQDDQAVAPSAEAKSGATGKTAAGKKQSADAEAKRKEQENLAIKKTRDENCANARNELINYKIGGRMYKVDENGERVFIDDQQIESGKAAAQKEVDRWCD